MAANQIVLIKKTAVINGQYAFFLECFQNEIVATNSLDHPNILSFIDYGFYDGSFYTVTNHVDGADLGTLISLPQFDDSIGLMVLTMALETLHHCHIQGLTHGDLKPSNLLIMRSGQVMLSGFGMTRMIISENQYLYFSTPLFMSPELVQLMDETNHFDSSQFEHTTLISCRNDSLSDEFQLSNTGDISQDIWAAGVLLYRLCTGSYPFIADDFPSLLASITQNNPMYHHNFRAEIPKSIISVISQCLQKDPQQRLNSLDPVLNVLHEHFHSQGIAFFSEYIAYYLSQKRDLSIFTVKADEFPEITFNRKEHPFVEQQHSSNPNGFETKALRHLVAPSYSLPQISTTPTVKIDPRIIRQAYASQHRRKNLFQELRTLSRVYRVHLVLAASIGAFLLLLFVSGSLFIEHLGNKSSKHTMTQRTEKKPHLRKNSHKKKIVSSTAFPEKPRAQKVNSSDPKDPIPLQITPVSQKTFDIAKLPDTHSLLKTKASQPILQPLTKKSTIVPANSRTTGTTRKRPPEPVVKDTKQVENSGEQTGTLKISVDPPHARVLVDGTPFDKYDFSAGKVLTTGSHTVTADAPEYEPYSNTISIETDQEAVLSLTLKVAQKGNGQAHIFSYPWANLFVDGELKGTTPTAVPIPLSEGTHDLSLQREGYETYTDQITVKTGDVLRLKVDMKKID